jgi:hypothetical protein
MDSRGIARIGLAGLAIALVVGVGGRALAQDQVDDALSSAGKVWYDRYCTPCHGPGGSPGTAVSRTTKQPVDLRTYVQSHGGSFPTTDWIAVVTDSRPASVHARVWERIRRDQAAGSRSSRSEAVARGTVGLIARYVNSIQTK